MRRLSIISMLLAALLAGCSGGGGQADPWQLYKSHFIGAEGGVVDAVNHGIRHSEGQGMGMLLAVANADRSTFDGIWRWTRTHLQVREQDRLLVWRWQPEAPHITDRNNATDGDLLVAWALLRAYDLWGDGNHLAAARAMIADLREQLIVERGGRLLLLPGRYGFVKEQGVIVNPSYWVFPALKAFALFEPEVPLWRELIRSGRALIAASLFGPWQLPADWLMVSADGELTPAAQFPKRFGLDAVRIPLYLQWAGFADHPAVLRCRDFWAQFSGEGAWPDWAGLEQTMVHLSGHMQGVRAIAQLIRPGRIHAFAPFDWQQAEYYQVTLRMISELARRDGVQMMKIEVARGERLP